MAPTSHAAVRLEEQEKIMRPKTDAATCRLAQLFENIPPPPRPMRSEEPRGDLGCVVHVDSGGIAVKMTRKMMWWFQLSGRPCEKTSRTEGREWIKARLYAHERQRGVEDVIPVDGLLLVEAGPDDDTTADAKLVVLSTVEDDYDQEHAKELESRTLKASEAARATEELLWQSRHRPGSSGSTSRGPLRGKEVGHQQPPKVNLGPGYDLSADVADLTSRQGALWTPLYVAQNQRRGGVGMLELRSVALPYRTDADNLAMIANSVDSGYYDDADDCAMEVELRGKFADKTGVALGLWRCVNNAALPSASSSLTGNSWLRSATPDRQFSTNTARSPAAPPASSLLCNAPATPCRLVSANSAFPAPMAPASRLRSTNSGVSRFASDNSGAATPLQSRGRPTFAMPAPVDHPVAGAASAAAIAAAGNGTGLSSTRTRPMSALTKGSTQHRPMSAMQKKPVAKRGLSARDTDEAADLLLSRLRR